MSQEPVKAAEDPSMEDILASIRRILNDDEAPAEQAAGEAHHASAVAPMGEDDVFQLDQSMLIDEPAPVSAGAPPPVAMEPAAAPAPVLPLRAEAAPEPERAPKQRAPEMTQADADEPLIAPSTAAAVSASMGALVRVMGQQQTPVYRGGPTLEDMVRDEIRPMVKSWLDEHLAPMVERMVRSEIARVTEGK